MDEADEVTIAPFAGDSLLGPLLDMRVSWRSDVDRLRGTASQMFSMRRDKSVG
jgi:hypothetical protein